MIYSVTKEKNRDIRSNLPQEEVRLISSFYNQEELCDDKANKVEAILRGYYKLKKTTIHCACMRLTIANRERFCITRQKNKMHDSECCLKNRPLNGARPKGSRPRPKETIINLMAGAQPRNPGQRPAGSADGNKKNSTAGSKRISSTVAAMYRLLDGANCHTISSIKRDKGDTVTSIEIAAKKILVTESFTFFDLLNIGDPNFSNLTDRLIKPPENWPTKECWHQIVLCSYDKFDRDSESNEIRLYKNNNKKMILKETLFNYSKIQINSPGNLSPNQSGPFLLMLVYVLGYSNTANKKPFPKLTKCAAIYINNHSELCPLESAYERQMLWGITTKLNKMDKSWLIKKPIFDDEDVRPDFIVSSTADDTICSGIVNLAT